MLVEKSDESRVQVPQGRHVGSPQGRHVGSPQGRHVGRKRLMNPGFEKKL